MYPNNEPRFSRGEKQTEESQSSSPDLNQFGPKALDFLSVIEKGMPEGEVSLISRFFDVVEAEAETCTIQACAKRLMVGTVFEMYCGPSCIDSNALVTLAYGALWNEQKKSGRGGVPVGLICSAVNVWYRAMHGQFAGPREMMMLSTAVGYALITASCVKSADLDDGTVVVTKPTDFDMSLFVAIHETLEKFDMEDMFEVKETPDSLLDSRRRCMVLMFTDAVDLGG